MLRIIRLEVNCSEIKKKKLFCATQVLRFHQHLLQGLHKSRLLAPFSNPLCVGVQAHLLDP